MFTMPETADQRLAISFRVPDAAFLTLAALVVLGTWGLLWYVYPQLPSPLPTHINAAGMVNSTSPKTWGLVFFPAIVQTGLTILLTWFWRHPQYSHLPGSVLLNLAPTPLRQPIVRIIRHSLVMTLLLIDLVFAYVALIMTNLGLGLPVHGQEWTLVGLVGLMVGLNIVYAVWVKKLVARVQPLVHPTP